MRAVVIDAGGSGTMAVMLVVMALAAAVIVAGTVAFARAERARLRRTREAVAARGWGWADTDPMLAERFQVRPFGGGDEREAREVITGDRAGRPFQAFRFVVTEHGRDSKGRRTTKRQDYQAVWVPLPATLPALRLGPDDAFQRVLTHLGWGDVDTESHAFNQRWRVGTAHEAYAHAVLAPHVIERLLDESWWGSTVIVEGPALLSVRPGRFSLDGLDAVLDRLEALADAIPPFVLADYGR